MRFKEKVSNAVKAVQEETQKQIENAKEAIENYKPNQLEKNIERCEKDIKKYNDLIDNIEYEFELKKAEYEYRLNAAEQEKKHTEGKLKAYRKENKE